jgi:hypothetical protein
MTAIFPPVFSNNRSESSDGIGDSFLEQRVTGFQSAITNVSAQLSQIVKWSDEIKVVLNTLADTQTEIKNSTSSVKTDEAAFKDTLTGIKNDIVTSLNSFDDKINEINNTGETVKDIPNSDQTDLFDIVFDTLGNISKQIATISDEFTPIQTSLEKSIVDNEEKIYVLLQTIFKQIQDYTSVIPLIDKNIAVLNTNISDLTQRMVSIENYICNSVCWYGKNEDTNEFDNESMIGWLMTATSGPTLISDGTSESYAIRQIFVASANMANKIYKIRFYQGKSNSFSDATILSESLYVKVGNLLSSVPIVVSSPLISKGNKLWCAIGCEAPAATLSLLIGI